MIFEALMQAVAREELIVQDGVFCRYHLRRDGQLTIHELIVLPWARGQGKARDVVRDLEHVPGVTCIVARCPADLDANAFYAHLGFVRVATHVTPAGRAVHTWRVIVR